MNDLNSLAKKMSSDPKFIKELVAAPEDTLKKNNFDVSDEMLTTMKGMSEAELVEMASNYSVDKAAC